MDRFIMLPLGMAIAVVVTLAALLCVTVYQRLNQEYLKRTQASYVPKLLGHTFTSHGLRTVNTVLFITLLVVVLLLYWIESRHFSYVMWVVVTLLSLGFLTTSRDIRVLTFAVVGIDICMLYVVLSPGILRLLAHLPVPVVAFWVSGFVLGLFAGMQVRNTPEPSAEENARIERLFERRPFVLQTALQVAAVTVLYWFVWLTHISEVVFPRQGTAGTIVIACILLIGDVYLWYEYSRRLGEPDRMEWKDSAVKEVFGILVWIGVWFTPTETIIGKLVYCFLLGPFAVEAAWTIIKRRYGRTSAEGKDTI